MKSMVSRVAILRFASPIIATIVKEWSVHSADAAQSTLSCVALDLVEMLNRCKNITIGGIRCAVSKFTVLHVARTTRGKDKNSA